MCFISRRPLTYRVIIIIAHDDNTFYFSASRRITFDKYGEEGLKAGLPTASGGFVEGYTFHGDSRKVFTDFFGGDNPFAGKPWHKITLLEIAIFLQGPWNNNV